MSASLVRNVANYVAEVLVLGFVIVLIVVGGAVMRAWKFFRK